MKMLKTWPKYFKAVADGTKTFEVRKNDRDFKVGDIIALQEWEPTTGEHTGGEVCIEVTYMLHLSDFFQQPNEYVILGFKKLEDNWEYGR